MSYCCQVIDKELMDNTTLSDKARSILSIHNTNYTEIQQLHILFSTIQTNIEEILETQQSNRYLFSTEKQQLIHNSNMFKKLTITFFYSQYNCQILEHSLIILQLLFNY